MVAVSEPGQVTPEGGWAAPCLGVPLRVTWSLFVPVFPTAALGPIAHVLPEFCVVRGAVCGQGTEGNCYVPLEELKPLSPDFLKRALSR